MKTLLVAISLAFALVVTGCNTTQQTTAYKTIASVEATATAAYDAYCVAIIKGYATTNQLPQVSRKFNQLQQACTVAASVSQNGPNALATANLTSELADLTVLIQSLIPTKH